jgi:hypothetical protein
LVVPLFLPKFAQELAAMDHELRKRGTTRSFARPLAQLSQRFLTDAFGKQGFASSELVTRWADIVGPEIAAHAEPLKIQWRRAAVDEPPEPATLMLRVEGPTALEIQHLSGTIIERVNRFLGWNAIGRIALRQAPLTRKPPPRPPRGADPEVTERIAASLPDIEDDALRQALARLGAMVRKR